jgi:hypothetical protein
MYQVMKTAVGTPVTQFKADVNGRSKRIDSNNIWLFTDPGARLLYFQQGRLQELIWDIRTHVMCGWQWSPEELEFKRQLQRLVQTGTLEPQPAFGHLSPHPTIYQALNEGVFKIGGDKRYFRSGDQIVFEPWLERIAQPGLTGPFRVGRLIVSNRYCLSWEAYPQLKGVCERELVSLHQTLNYHRARVG